MSKVSIQALHSRPAGAPLPRASGAGQSQPGTALESPAPHRPVPIRGIKPPLVDAASRAVAAVLMGMVRLYQITLSPYIGGQCRFHPTCSNYALDALANHGPLRGSWLALKRLLKCHPFHPGGFDPAPR